MADARNFQRHLAHLFDEGRGRGQARPTRRRLRDPGTCWRAAVARHGEDVVLGLVLRALVDAGLLDEVDGNEGTAA